MLDRPPLLVFDVESVGLHGEGFAFGVVLIEHDEITKEMLAWFHPDLAVGSDEDRAWINENVLPGLVRATSVPTHSTPRGLRDEFWALWMAAKRRGAQLMGDVCWPVEANFLTRCIADMPTTRAWDGPYPLYDAGTLTLAGLATEYAPAEAHNPLEDARATWESIRDWWASGD